MNSRERIISALQKEMDEVHKNFIIFPYSELGKFRVKILNRMFKIKEKLIIDNNGMKIIYKTKSYRPFILREIGMIEENFSKYLDRVLCGTWAYYGFESIVWAKKK